MRTCLASTCRPPRLGRPGVSSAARASLVLLAGLAACANKEPGLGSVLINEVAPSNASGFEDNGTFPDWIELYNPGEDEVQLGGWTLTDDLEVKDKWTFAEGTSIQPGKFLVVICDSDTGEGPTHTNFDLDKLGEDVGLFDAEGQVIDKLSYGPIATDYTWARMPGEDDIVIVWPPTPAAKNRLDPQPPGGAP